MKINGICQDDDEYVLTPVEKNSFTKKCKPYTRLFIIITISGSLVNVRKFG